MFVYNNEIKHFNIQHLFQKWGSLEPVGKFSIFNRKPYQVTEKLSHLREHKKLHKNRGHLKFSCQNFRFFQG
jgi:hypothetical protein